jgi:ATP-dependent protease ClpP protease subunit
LSEVEQDKRNSEHHTLFKKIIDETEIRIHSTGGYVSEGSQFYNLIKNKFNKRTTTILDSRGYSMGAIIFCMGDKRIVTPRSDIMFHDYSAGFAGKCNHY